MSRTARKLAGDGHNPKPFRLVRRDENLYWPSGDDAWVADLAVADAELESCVGGPLATWWAEGLGPATGVGLVLASGRPVELIRYEDVPPGGATAKPFLLMADAADDSDAALTETLAALGLTTAVVASRPVR